jgi:hypothetical protein
MRISHLFASKLGLLLVAPFIFLGPIRSVAEERDALEKTFLTPPVAAKPAVWWFWGESVTTDHGITQDLEALKRVGFGGVVLYEQVFADGARPICRCGVRAAAHDAGSQYLQRLCRRRAVDHAGTRDAAAGLERNAGGRRAKVFRPPAATADQAQFLPGCRRGRISFPCRRRIANRTASSHE